METARAAARRDLDDLARLWRAAVADLAGQRGGLLLADGLGGEDLAAWLADGLADPDRLVVLGLIDASPVGMAAAAADRARREPLGVLEAIYVEPGARQVGVAEAMLDLVVSWCDARGLLGLDAPALPGNRAAKSFFEDNGFQARLLVMHRSAASRP